MTTNDQHPLAGFERLVGGSWHLGPNYHVFEWGLAKQVLRSTSYFPGEDRPAQGAEGFFYWHPGEQTIKAVGLTIPGEAVSFFDYTAIRWETGADGAAKMVNDLTTYDGAGQGTDYLEVWEFPNNDTYHWTLHLKTPEGLQKVMDGTFTRKN